MTSKQVNKRKRVKNKQAELKQAEPKQVKPKQTEPNQAKQKQAKPEKAKQKQAKPSQRTASQEGTKRFPWRPLIVTACIIVLVLAILYPVGREYYQTLRTQQRLEAQIEAVTERNEAVEAENEALQTEEGIENQARSEYGWVKEGENSAVVTNDQGTVDNASRLPEHLDKDSITAPKTWYYNILDFIFFVHE